MLLFVGLGNPGQKYAGNRHNIGFMALDTIGRVYGMPVWRSRFQGRVSEGQIGSERIVLLQPDTFMNESGRAVREAARFYRIGVEAITVFHDELDLAPGKCRIKQGGGAAGHNGLRSITTHLSADFRRVRMGIGHPGHKDLVHAYVLNDFAKSEKPWVDGLCDGIARNVDSLIAGRDAEFQNKVHLVMDAAGFSTVKQVGEA